MSLRGILIVGVVGVLLAGCDVMEDLIPDPQLDWTVKLGLPSLCKKLGGETEEKQQSRQDRCLAQIAEKKGNVKICDQINNENRKISCRQQQGIEPTGTTVNCEQADQSNKDNCLFQDAMKQKEISGCDGIADPKTKGDCQAQVAKATNNDLWCEKITYPQAKEDCYYDFAMLRHDAKFCSWLNEVYRKSNCLKTVAEATDDVNLCQTVEDNELKQSCLYGLAVKQKNTTGCQLMTPTQERYADCFINVATQLKDANQCAKIEANGTRDKCIHNVAVQAHDKAVCTAIENQAEKRRCEDYTGLTQIQP